MKSGKNLYIIIPCYNEGEGICKTLQNLLEVRSDAVAVVVNDGSNDDSAQKIRSMMTGDRIRLIDLPFNTGIGTAVETGLLYAVRHNADYAVKFDADGQHLPEEIESLLVPLVRGEADMTLGSRFISRIDGFKSTALRRTGIHFFRILSYLLTGQAITDSTSGFRAYNREALAFVSRYYPAFDYPEPEENILLIRNHFRIREIPCKMNIRQSGKSSIRPLKAAYYMFKVALSMTMAWLRPPKEERNLKQ